MKIDPESWPALSRLLDEWIDLPAGSREDWLRGLAPEDAALLPTLRQLILAEKRLETGDFLNALPTIEGTEGSQPPSALLAAGLRAGETIGPYCLIRELGKGGMGVVWLAERADGQLKRPVALKIPIVSLHSRAMVDRFSRERNILAQLTHPRIARLYDAGITDRGQPFLAIEYVEGETITGHCDRRRLGLLPRLRLFLQILDAVQYAHTNLVVHRDLKPANILIAKDGEVRLLDFGIAKLLTDGEAHETELTRAGGRLLTPDYASPEQIAGNAITTASDVYSLGVVLFELLTGERPYRVRRDTPLSLEEAVLSGDPVRPSQAVVDPAKAHARGITPKKLARDLKGDLDTIVLKALSKTSRDRYLTADAFAQDLTRYLAGEPVLARPESRWYRARKFVKRNKLAVGFAASVFLAVLAAAMAAGVALYEARQAQHRFAQVRELANRLIFDFEAAIRDTPGTLAARRMVAATARRHLAALATDARADPGLALELAEAYYRLSQVEFSAEETVSSTEHLRQALDLLRGQPDGCCRTPQQRFLFISALSDLSRNLENGGDLQASLAASTESVAGARAWLDASPRELLARRALVIALLSQGSILGVMVRLPDAHRADAEALQRAEQLFAGAPQSEDLAFDRVQAGHSLAVVERGLGHYAEGLEDERQAIEVLDAMLKRHPENIRWRKWRVRMQSTMATLLARLSEKDPTVREQVLPAMWQAYQLARENVERNPGDNTLVDDRVVMAARLARHLGSVGRPTEGLPLVEESLAVANELADTDPAVRRNRVLQLDVLQLKGELLMEAHRWKDAGNVLADADLDTTDVLQRWPADVEFLNDRANILLTRSVICTRLGDLQAAREHCTGGLTVVASMVHKNIQGFSVDALAGLRAQAKQLGLPDTPLLTGARQ